VSAQGRRYQPQPTPPPSFVSRLIFPLLFSFSSSETRKESEALIFQVSNFVLKRQLGQGAGGRVFLGRHVEDRNRRAAIKIIHKRSSNAKAVRMVLTSFLFSLTCCVVPRI